MGLSCEVVQIVRLNLRWSAHLIVCIWADKSSWCRARKLACNIHMKKPWVAEVADAYSHIAQPDEGFVGVVQDM